MVQDQDQVWLCVPLHLTTMSSIEMDDLSNKKSTDDHKTDAFHDPTDGALAIWTWVSASMCVVSPVARHVHSYSS